MEKIENPITGQVMGFVRSDREASPARAGGPPCAAHAVAAVGRLCGPHLSEAMERGRDQRAQPLGAGARRSEGRRIP